MHRNIKAMNEKSLKVLMVDDEEMILETVCVLLERYGYSVTSVDSGEKAIDLLKQDDHGIDIIILDMLMPGMDGCETFDHVRRIQPDMPVLIASGRTYSDQIDRVKNNGCKGILQKPYRASDLHMEIQKCFS